MNLLYLWLFFQSAKSSCCLNCNIKTINLDLTYNCLTCSSSFNLYKSNCVQKCGYGYTSTNNICVANGQNLNFLHINFNSVNNFNLNKIGNFTTVDGSSFINQGNFMMTVDRGFYSDSLSNLVGMDSWVPTTDFSIQIYFRPQASNGIIFQIMNTHNVPFLNVFMINKIFRVSVYTVSQLDTNTHVTNVDTSAIDPTDV